MAIRSFALGGRRALTAALVAGCVACAAEPPAVEAPGRAAPETSLQGVVLEGYAAGSSEFRVQADSARIDPVERIAHLEQVRIDFSDRQSGPVSVRAAEGEFALERDDFALRGGVTGATGEGEHFETDDLRYDASTRSLRTDAPVRMTRSNLEFQGRGMRLDVDSRRLRFTGRVTATSVPPESQ